jgi:hypothetical protein
MTPRDHKMRLTDAGADEVVPALMAWFRSQDLSRADGAVICLRFLAEHLARMANDRAHLAEGLRLTALCTGYRATEIFSHLPSGSGGR